MLFYEPIFLYLFFPIVFIAFLAIRRVEAARVAVLLVASLFFYLWSEPLFVPVVLASCLADYHLSTQIERNNKRRLCLIMGILINIEILLYYKYTNFAVDNLDGLSGLFNAEC